MEKLLKWKENIRKYMRMTNLEYLPSFNNEKKEKKYILRCAENGGAFTVLSESKNRRYVIVFPEDAPPLDDIFHQDSEDEEDEEDNEDDKKYTNHQKIIPNLPFCSCRSYMYKCYDKKNEKGKRGACKHLIEILESVDLDYFWNFRDNFVNCKNDPWVINSYSK
jgi:hypothetical protein